MSATTDLGAKLGGVKGLVPALPIDGASKPSAPDVEAYLEARSLEVLVRVGERLRALDVAAVAHVELGDDAQRAKAWAAALAEVGAAGDAMGAAYPEGADVEQTDTTADGALHKRFRDGLADLEAALDRLLADNDATTVSADRDPAVCSPRPLFTTCTRW